MAALELQAIVGVESARGELAPGFPDQFAAALEAAEDSLKRLAQDGFDLLDYAALTDVGWTS